MRHVLRFLELTALTAGMLIFLITGVRAEVDVSATKEAIIERLSGDSTALEARLFADAADGRLDDFSQLDTALIASGENRDAMLRHYEDRLNRLLDELRPSIDPSQREEKNAERVFEFMHRRVLHGKYQLECTDIRMAFDEGRYNCVSASVLFNCLANGIGMNCCGLEAPGHAKSRVFLPGGYLDVETTCPRWFQLLLDPSKQAEAVSKTLGKTLNSDHFSAREVGPIQMTAMLFYNRGVDYLAEKRFAEAAAVNAKALRLDPRNATARGNFLATLNNWSLDAAAARRYAEAFDLLQAGLVYERQYAAFQQNFVYLHHRWSEQLCRAGKYAEAIERLRRAAAELPEMEYLNQSIQEVSRCWEQSKESKKID